MALKKEPQNGTGVHPVKTLQDHIKSLDAAMLVATTAAEVGAVHKLRTGTRRVEAHLQLVDLLQHVTEPKAIPGHVTEAKAVHRRLRRVRRAAGAVRDLDVQADAIWYDAPAKTAANDDAIAAVRKQAKSLRKHLNHRRGTEAAKLIDVLHAQQEKLAAALRAVEQAMKPASRPAIDPANMAAHVQKWFTSEAQALLQPSPKHARRKASLQSRLEALDEDALHNLRKVAKLCRYMAESAADDLHAKQLAGQFEAVQEAGGKWHDWLLLAQLSKGFHGKKADLTQRYAQHSEQALAKYRQTLLSLLPSLTATVDL